jgi:hypothetical protein
MFHVLHTHVKHVLNVSSVFSLILHSYYKCSRVRRESGEGLADAETGAERTRGQGEGGQGRAAWASGSARPSGRSGASHTLTIIKNY